MYYSLFTADAFRKHNVTGQMFSTFDKDNVYHCARNTGSGWWYNYCTFVDLNVPFFSDHTESVWYPFISKGKECNVTEMLIKRN